MRYLPIVLAVTVFTACVAVALRAGGSNDTRYLAAGVVVTPATSNPARGVQPPTVRTVARHGRSAPRRTPSLNWQALAECESGGDWQTNTGNGYYGGVQFDLRTWAGVGGHGLPSDASKAEQLHRARLLYADRGRAPWPQCGGLL